MNVSEICAEGIFVTFPWWLENVKCRSKIALFSNERHFEIWFPKKRTITFFWSKLSKLHKKDPILHVATTFSLKQGGTSHGPIPHPLMHTIFFCIMVILITGKTQINFSPWQKKGNCVAVWDLRSKYIDRLHLMLCMLTRDFVQNTSDVTFSQNYSNFCKNHWTNTRLICAHFNAFFMLSPNIILKL